MEEQRKGKLLKADPLLVKGEHYQKESEYNGIKNTYYYFVLEFDNGDKGNSKAKTPQGSYKVGDEYTYVKWEYENNGYKNFNFTKLNNLSYKGGGSYNRAPAADPKQSLNTTAFIATNMVMKQIDEEYLVVFTTLRKWLYEQVLDKKESVTPVSEALKIAAAYFAGIGKDIKTKSVTVFADTLIEKLKDVSWTEKVADPAPVSDTQEELPKETGGFPFN